MSVCIFVLKVYTCSAPHLDNLSSEQVIDDHAPRSAASVDEALARGVSRREMAPWGIQGQDLSGVYHFIPDQGLEDGVSCVGHQARVPLHLGPQLSHVPIKVIRVNITFNVKTKIFFQGPSLAL